MDSKTCLLYLPFTTPAGTPMGGDGIVRSWDGQILQTEGNPQWRHGSMWNHHGGWGLEIAEECTNAFSTPFNEDKEEGDTGVPTRWSAYNATYTYGLREWVKAMFGADGLATRLVASAGSNKGICLSNVTAGTAVSFYGLGWDWNDTSFYTLTGNHAASRQLIGSFNGAPVYRIWITKSTDTQHVYIRPNDNNGDFDCWMTGWQQETSDYPTPLNTVGEARTSQYLEIPIAGNWPGFDEGSVVIGFRPGWKYNNPPSWAKLLSLWDGNTHSYIQYWSSSNKFGANFGGGTSAAVSSTHDLGDQLLLVITWKGTSLKASLNGSTYAVGTVPSITRYPLQKMFLGRAYNVDSQHINGVIGELAILNHELKQEHADELYSVFENKRSLRDYIL